MERIASLRLAARQLRASIFRSLPLGFRLAHAIVVASSLGESLGRYFGAIFLKAGVEGMPDPGPRWNPDSPRASDTLPRGYLEDYGESLYRGMLRFSRDIGWVADTIADFLAYHKDVVPRKGSSLSDAQGYVRRSVSNFFLDKLKKNKRRDELARFERMEGEDDEGKATVMDFDDPSAFEKFDEYVTESKVREIKREIAKIVPWAPKWLDMLMEGEQETDIIGDPKTGRPSALAEQMGLDTPYLTTSDGTPMSYPMWSNRYKKKVVEKMKEIYAR